MTTHRTATRQEWLRERIALLESEKELTRKSDELGKELARELYQIFRREKEQSVEPVTKEDVAEVLRRRFFTPKSLPPPLHSHFNDFDQGPSPSTSRQISVPKTPSPGHPSSLTSSSY